METKKYEHQRIEHKIPLFYMIGLNIALLLTIAAFQWKTESTPKVMPDQRGSIFSDPLIYIPPTDIQPPLPSNSEEYKEVKHEIPTEPPIELEPPVVPENPESGEIDIIELPALPPDPIDDEPFIFVEEMPSFPGGWNAFYKFLGDNMKYPKAAQRLGIEGRVHLEFVIEKDGSITDLKVVKGMKGGLDEEALRVMGLIPNFNPGKQRGRPVRVRQAISINFQLKN
jgi:protein TonB